MPSNSNTSISALAYHYLSNRYTLAYLLAASYRRRTKRIFASRVSRISFSAISAKAHGGRSRATRLANSWRRPCQITMADRRFSMQRGTLMADRLDVLRLVGSGRPAMLIANEPSAPHTLECSRRFWDQRPPASLSSRLPTRSPSSSGDKQDQILVSSNVEAAKISSTLSWRFESPCS